MAGISARRDRQAAAAAIPAMTTVAGSSWRRQALARRRRRGRPPVRRRRPARTAVAAMPRPRTSIRPGERLGARARAGGRGRPRARRGRPRPAARTQAAGLRRLDQREREPRLAGAGGSADEDAARADQARPMAWMVPAFGHHIAGRRTMKRAPSTSAGCIAGGRLMRFSTQQAAVMGLDDLLGDRQAEAGILAEALVRPVGVEALEDLLERVRPHARPVVVDDDLDLGLEPPAGDAHGAAGRRERARIVDQVVDHLAEPRIVAGHHEGARPAALEGQRRR